ncbi:MAG: peptidoglycan-binding protein, partial [Candidatus Daviesbacteria bacterium]
QTLITGTSNLTFQNNALCDPTGVDCNVIPATWTGGTVSVTSPTPTPTLTPTPTPSPTPTPTLTPTPSPTPTQTPTPVSTPPSGGGGGGGSGGIMDITPPADITNLSIASCASNSCMLSWTAPGDDGNLGTALEYDIRYYTTNITDFIWNNSMFVKSKPIPQSAGSTQSYTVANLLDNVTYYFAIKTRDESNNWSKLSNIPSVKTGTKFISSPVSTPTPTPTSTIPSTPITNLSTNELKGPFSFGMTSDQVKLLQEILAQDKEIYPEGLTTGYYGTLTQKAVERFQCKYNIICFGTPDTTGYGLVGPKTRLKINEIFSTPAPIPPQSTPAPSSPFTGGLIGPCIFGITSDQNKLLQKRLAQDKEIYPEGLTTGYYGTLTKMAVQRFQCKYNIVCSGTPEETGYGLAGPKTRAKINEIFSNQD